jgi:hypothetical protein
MFTLQATNNKITETINEYNTGLREAPHLTLTTFRNMSL